ncbi:MAG: hypothetical protein ACE5H9_03855 [Anaerolineae bacterium]
MLRRGLLCVVSILGLALLNPSRLQGQGDDVCLYDPANIANNCAFSEGLNHWTPFVLAGNPSISTIDGNPACHAPLCPALYLTSNGAFEAGVYQQMPATPGVNYFAQVAWFVWNPTGDFDNIVMRKVGIDPAGGVDPAAPTVVWGQEVWTGIGNCPNKFCPGLNVTATAQNSQITVFLLVRDTFPARPGVMPGTDEFWIDDIGLIPVGGQPLLAPTDTPLPPAPTNTPPLPTDTTATPVPTDTPTPEPSPTSTPAPTETPQPTATTTATDTPSPAPTATPGPTFTPSPTLPPGTPASPSRAPAPTSGNDLLELFNVVGGTFICLVFAAVLTLSITGIVLYYFYKVGTSANDAVGEFEDG